MNEGSTPQGWQCPECKTVYAPSVDRCECAKPVQEATSWVIDWMPDNTRIYKSGVDYTPTTWRFWHSNTSTQ